MGIEKKAKMSKSKIKSMLVVIFKDKGVTPKESVSSGQTITAHYTDVLERLSKSVRRV